MYSCLNVAIRCRWRHGWAVWRNRWRTASGVTSPRLCLCTRTSPESSGSWTSLLRWLSLDLRSGGATTWSWCLKGWKKATTVLWRITTGNRFVFGDDDDAHSASAVIDRDLKKMLQTWLQNQVLRFKPHSKCPYIHPYIHAVPSGAGLCAAVLLWLSDSSTFLRLTCPWLLFE